MQFYIFFLHTFFFFFFNSLFWLLEQLYPDCCSPLRRLFSRRFIFRSSVLISPPPHSGVSFLPLRITQSELQFYLGVIYSIHECVLKSRPSCDCAQQNKHCHLRKKSLNWSIVWPSARRKCSQLYFIRVESLFLLPYKNSFGKVTNIESTARWRSSSG